MLLLLHKTLKCSRNIQGFALIRAVLFLFKTVPHAALFFEFYCHLKMLLRWTSSGTDNLSHLSNVKMTASFWCVFFVLYVDYKRDIKGLFGGM